MTQPQLAQLFRREQRDVRAGKLFAQTQQRRSGHDRVAQPVYAAHENAARMERRGWRMVSHESRSISYPPSSIFATGSASSSSDFGLLSSGFRPFHRSWTQNQFAGSRRTATSKARFTSSMISAMGRASRFTRVGISAPISIRHLARATR